MATVKKIRISREWNERPEDDIDIAGEIYFVEKGQTYDLLQFTLEELGYDYFWHESLCVPCGKTEKELLEIARNYAKTQITDERLNNYRRFLDYGEKYGWD